MNGMNDIIDVFPSISLKEMAGVSLQKRTDTKFVIPESDLTSVLGQIKDDYKILEIDNHRIMTYNTLYFDTAEKKFFHDHHNGKSNREKVRIRKYVESGGCFLEIKQKDPKGRTNKFRRAIPDFETELSETSTDLIRKTTRKNYKLFPTIRNRFNRITLVNKTGKERVTIDLNLSVKKNETVRDYGNLVIIEVKQERSNRNTSIVKALRKYQHYPYRFSKYCIGMISIYGDLKYNRFKSQLIKIEKLESRSWNS